MQVRFCIICGGEIRNKNSVSIEMPPRTTVHQALMIYAEQYGFLSLAEKPGKYTILLNGGRMRLGKELEDGDTVTVLSLIAGG